MVRIQRQSVTPCPFAKRSVVKNKVFTGIGPRFEGDSARRQSQSLFEGPEDGVKKSNGPVIVPIQGPKHGRGGYTAG